MQKQPSGKKRNGSAAAGKSDGQSVQVNLGVDLGIEQARALHAQLLPYLDNGEKVVLDGSEVERIHAAALQLFCLFCRDRRAAGREVELLRPSETLRNAAALLGATTLLNIARAQV